MPEFLKLDPALYSLRHIRVGTPLDPTGTFEMGALPNASATTVLGQSASFLELPISELISSPDLASGTWTARLGDAGTWQVQFPNKAASDGINWKDRFTNFGRSDWIEIRRGSNLELTGCIEDIKPDYQSVTVSGHDGFWMLKNSYERDWQCLQAPRDVMEHASRVAVPTLVDTFLEGSLNSSLWTQATVGSALVTLTTKGLLLATLAGASSATVTSVASFQWFQARFLLTFALSIPATGWSTGGTFDINVGPGALVIGGSPSAPVAVLSSTAGGRITQVNLAPFANSTVTVVLECDGRWLRAYVNGQFVGYVQSDTASDVTTLDFSVTGGTGISAYVSNFVFEEWKPFLMAGSDQGDYVLPGTAQTYPTGGLHARYYNDVGISGLSTATYLAEVLNPGNDNPASGQPAPYDVIEPILNGSTGPNAHVTSGFATTNWSAKFFGAIWLPLAQGSVTFTVFNNSDGGAPTSAIRVWVGKTQFGAQQLDQWAANGETQYGFTVTAASLAGPSGVGVSGWYPIVIETSAISATTSPTLQFAGTFSWTDPGGTVIAANTATTVPSTSLSPLGCVDQRYQGVSYFDMYQQTGNAFGHQFACEPQQLESGVFPGVLAPRLREGHDTDEVLKADLSDGVSPVINYANESDATDQCSSMYGIGAGINDGQGSQLQTQVFDITTLLNSLFDMQGWVDASDVSYLALLAQRVASQLALQSTPWQNLTGDPRGTDRLADTFPLTGVLSEFHWRPGDGVRFYLPDVNVIDAEPRQITQVTRTFGPTGRTSSSMQPGIAGNLLQRPT